MRLRNELRPILFCSSAPMPAAGRIFRARLRFLALAVFLALGAADALTARAGLAVGSDEPFPKLVPPASFSSVAARVRKASVVILAEKGPRESSVSGRVHTAIAAGTGVVVDPRGYVVTSYNIIKDASRVRIVLPNGEQVGAALYAVEAQAGVAVLKMDGSPRAFIPLGDSDRLDVGDWVVAVSTPLALSSGTVQISLGIVTAKGRRLVPSLEYDELVMTDAVVDPGNSGGALVNARGELVGVGTAPMIAKGARTGVGIAIPVNRADELVGSVLAFARPLDGSIGVETQDATPKLAEALGAPSSSGALLTSIVDGGPAGIAGLRRGDIVVAFSGRAISGEEELRCRIAEAVPGTSASVDFYRNGRRERVHVSVVRARATVPRQTSETTWKPAVTSRLGLTLRPLTDTLAMQLGYEGRRGVVVLDVSPWGTSFGAGLERGDLVEEVNGRTIENVEEFVQFAEHSREDAPLLLYIWRGARGRFIAIEHSGARTIVNATP